MDAPSPGKDPTLTDAALVLTVLGTGDAFATGGHPYSCYLLEPMEESGGECRSVLLDCGPTAVPMLHGMDHDLGKIDLVLLTHLHGDHAMGVAFLYLNYQFLVQRDRPLIVAGPPGTEETCEAIFRVGYPETVKLMDRNFEVKYVELTEGRETDLSGLRILPREVTHMREGTPYGYRISWKGKTIGLSGDTEWDEALIELADGTDVFIIECFSTEKIRFHISVETLKKNAPRLRTQRLLLTHMGEDVRALAAAGKIPFETARDGQRLEL